MVLGAMKRIVINYGLRIQITLVIYTRISLELIVDNDTLMASRTFLIELDKKSLDS